MSIASIWLRPLWPVDETRYASVAWEMWLRGDFVVPHINGEPYSHKPPLLFWLIHLGWAIFDVNDWWPRLVAPLCALGAVPLMLRLARLLWPHTTDEHEAARSYSVWVLFGSLLFAGFITLTMFDLLLMLCAMVSMVGVLYLSKNEKLKGILWLGAGIGLGVLAKGPVILLHVLPAAVVAPWWAPQLRARSGRWYLDLLLGVLLGAVIALAWALPAGYLGGEQYQRAIFWGQTAGRVAESFAHRAPWWYYLPLLPVILFPAFVFPRFWVGLRTIAKEHSTHFLAAWIVLTVLGFSLVSGKQAKYLLPMLPAFALLAGRALSRVHDAPRWWALLPPALGFLALPVVLAWLRSRPEGMRLPEWAGEVPLWPIVLLALVPPILLFFGKRPVATQLRALAFATLAALAVIGAGVVPAFVPYSDPGPAARHLSALQEAKVPLAHLGKYHATYNFVGRLAKPIAILDHTEARAWIRANPAGQVMTVERTRAPDGAPGLERQWHFRGAWLQLWRAEALLATRSDLR